MVQYIKDYCKECLSCQKLTPYNSIKTYDYIGCNVKEELRNKMKKVYENAWK